MMLDNRTYTIKTIVARLAIELSELEQVKPEKDVSEIKEIIARKEKMLKELQEMFEDSPEAKK